MTSFLSFSTSRVCICYISFSMKKILKSCFVPAGISKPNRKAAGLVSEPGTLLLSLITLLVTDLLFLLMTVNEAPAFPHVPKNRTHRFCAAKPPSAFVESKHLHQRDINRFHHCKYSRQDTEPGPVRGYEGEEWMTGASR